MLVRVPLTMPPKMLRRVDERVGKQERTAWIREAVREKLEREGTEARRTNTADHWATMSREARRDEIMEGMGASEWSWIEEDCSGMSVEEIQGWMLEMFDVDREDTYGLAWAIHKELK